MRTLRDKTCYACDRAAIDREHFPPRAFVPKTHRDGAFLTLPACRGHNQANGRDVQYAWALTALVAASTYDNAEASARLVRTLRHSSGSLGRRLDRAASPVGPHLAFKVERDRYDRVIGDVARAAYFVETAGERKMMGELVVSAQANGTTQRIEGFETHHERWAEYARGWFEDTARLPVRARDDRIFFYQVHVEGQVVLLVFYGQVEILVASRARSRARRRSRGRALAVD